MEEVLSFTQKDQNQVSLDVDVLIPFDNLMK